MSKELDGDESGKHLPDARTEIVHPFQVEVDSLSREERLEMIVRAGRLGLWDYNIATDVLHCERRWYEIVGHSSDRPVRNIDDFRPMVHPEDVDRATEVPMTAAELLRSKQDYAIVFRIVRPDGETRWIRSAACLMVDDKGVAYRAIGFIVDISDRLVEHQKVYEDNLSLLAEKTALLSRMEELAAQTLIDPLTGIANRRALSIEIERLYTRCGVDGDRLSVLVVDVDFFKQYNDLYGHLKGDQVLQAVAGVLKDSILRPHDFVARFGGEEFVVLLPYTEDAQPVVDRIWSGIRALNVRHAGSPVERRLTVSCGGVSAVCHSSGKSADLLSKGDAALYRAKDLGRDRYVAVRLD